MQVRQTYLPSATPWVVTRKFGLSVGDALAEQLDDHPAAFESRAAWIRYLVRLGLAAHEPLAARDDTDVRAREAMVRQALYDYLDGAAGGQSSE